MKKVTVPPLLEDFDPGTVGGIISVWNDGGSQGPLMPKQSHTGRFIRFGVFEVDLRSRELRKKGLKVKLQDQPYEVLLALLERPGEIVSREEMRQRIWHSDTFVDFDHSLNTAILKIRAALGDLAKSPRFVETVPRQGYRFIASVEASDEALARTAPNLDRPRGAKRKWLLSAFLIAGVIAASAIWFLLIRAPAPPVPMRIVPLTSYPGGEWPGGFSPDGRKVAFTRCEPGIWGTHGNCDLYIKLLDSEEAVRLTDYPFMDVFGAWSPDDRWIAFLRYPPEGRPAYFLVPATGGVPRKLVETCFPMPHVAGGNPISWFPDGKRMVVTRQESSDDPLSLFLLSVELDEQRWLTDPPADFFGDTDPAVSPDGRTIIFNRMIRDDTGNLYLLELTDELRPRGQPAQLTSDGKRTEGLVWTPDGREIIFASGTLWRMEVSGRRAGKPERLPFTQGVLSHPVISPDGRHLAYSQKNSVADILRVELSDPATAAGPPVRFISSTRTELHAEYSADGKRIAFVTSRSGRPEIWTCDSDGSNLRRLVSNFEWTGEFRLSWSPDGEWIAFTSAGEGNRDVSVVRSQGGVPKRLTSEPSQDVSGSWSYDGKWIYFTSDRGGEPGIWKVRAEGGEPVQVAKEEAWAVVESPAKNTLYYLKAGEPMHHSLWRMQLEDGEKSRILDSVFQGNYAVVDEGIYFIPRRDSDCRCYHLQFFEFSSGEIHTVVDVEVPSWSFSPSPDGRSLLYAQFTEFESDVMLVDDFR